MSWERFINIISSVAGQGTYTKEQRILEDLGIDSFVMMKILCELEEAGGSFDFSSNNEINTLGELFERISRT